MAEGLILEFEGFGVERYEAVNEVLGIDPETGAGEWPSGMLFHAGGAKDGGWVVLEVWSSQEDQGRFMEDRLGPALKEGGVTDPPSRIEWLDLPTYRTLG